MKIGILGSGPSGLVAAHALRSEHKLQIFSTGGKSAVYGAQYLHAPIPGIPLPEPTVIRYVWNSEPEPYLRKVYGENWDGSVSDECHTQAHLAWDLRTAYDRLWEQFGGYVNDVDLNAHVVREMAEQCDLILNTIPRPALCVDKGHKFNAVPIYAIGDSPNGSAPDLAEEGQILYNGLEDSGWYRAAKVYGFRTVEWPGIRKKPPQDGVVKVNKPLSHNCDCHTNLPIRHLGRMGKWASGNLVHHVYPDAVEAVTLKELGEI